MKLDKTFVSSLVTDIVKVGDQNADPLEKWRGFLVTND